MRTSVVTAPWLQSTGSVVVSHGVSCSMACRIFPDQGSCTVRQILYHRATTEALICCILPSESILKFSQWPDDEEDQFKAERGGWSTSDSGTLLFKIFFLTCWFKLPALIGQESTNVETANTLIAYESETNSGQVCWNISRERKTCCFQNALK